METVSDFIFLNSKVTLDHDCSHEIKVGLPLRRKTMTNLDSRFRNRHTTLLSKVHIVKVIIFPVVMYRYESWAIKKTECQKK